MGVDGTGESNGGKCWTTITKQQSKNTICKNMGYKNIDWEADLNILYKSNTFNNNVTGNEYTMLI